MAYTLDQLEDRLLALPEGDRAHLANSLLESLGHTHEDYMEFSPEYTAELDRRSAEIANGTVAMIPFEEAMKHIDELLRG